MHNNIVFPWKIKKQKQRIIMLLNFAAKNKFLLISTITLVVICSILFNEVLLGKNVFLGPDSLSPKAVKAGIELAESNYETYITNIFIRHNFKEHFIIRKSVIYKNRVITNIATF